MDLKRDLSFAPEATADDLARQRRDRLQYINLKLAANGLPVVEEAGGSELVDLASGLLANFGERSRLLADHRCPADVRIESFLGEHFADVTSAEAPLRLPGRTLILDRHGIARELSLPANGDLFESELVRSYRTVNGVLHNPRFDRRTTRGTFHICDGGLPIPADKLSVPRATFVELFRRALQPPDELLLLPFTSQTARPGRTFVSLLLRPLVRPEVAGICPSMTMECRFFAPGSLVSNLDFVESIFGNGGDPYLPFNDAGLDVEHWTGHTGCVILAPHLTGVTKRELRLPHIDEATALQREQGMCWSDEQELYNGGQPFKATCRTEAGVVLTLISDNYFGYCKKEVKTQISYAANLMGGVEEEHAGGALVFPSWSLGESFQVDSKRYNGRTFDDVVRDFGEWMDVQPEGYAVDKTFANLLYISEQARADLRGQRIMWTRDGVEQEIPLLPGRVYMAPSGYKIRLEKHPAAPSWRIVGTAGEGIFCHKPCTVSGGGKSEISKSVVDYMQYGPVFVADFEEDMAIVDEMLSRDYTGRWSADMQDQQRYDQYPSRSILNPQRSLGSVIKLLTPSAEYSAEYNAWLDGIPEHVYALVFAIKRFHHEDWGDDWRKHFGVDVVNGSPGHELKLHSRSIVGSYLRVGFANEGRWRTFKLRQDFAAAAKVQTEDDISASVVVPSRVIPAVVRPPGRPSDRASDPPAYKFVTNCEYRLFQRPDDAVHRGLDKQAEADLARRDVNFISNFEPLTREVVHDMLEKVIDFDAFTGPMQELLRSVEKGESRYVVCSDNPRNIDGVPSKNPRYLQDRPDLVRPLDRHVAIMGTRLYRGIPANQPVLLPVSAVLAGRRLNPPDPVRGFRSLAVYGPIHYQELPELFMDYIASLTGKSPSTTGAGSEGALTKGPFNMLRPAADLNAALVSMILTNLEGFTTAAGFVGPDFRVDHDISLLIPEVWCRMTPEERSARYLRDEQMLEPVPDVTVNGETVSGHRLGFRVTRRFIHHFFGRVFDNPDKVFVDSILRPETQDTAAFADGVKHIREAHQRVARQYFQDGTIEDLCPPLRALVTIMAEGRWQGYDEHAPELRQMFTYESLIASDWYRERLDVQQQRDISRWQRRLEYARQCLKSEVYKDADLSSQIEICERHLADAQSEAYLQQLQGAIGAQSSSCSASSAAF